MTIRPLTPADADQCDACAEAVRAQPGWVATGAAGAVEGFLTVTRPRPTSAEITWMAVEPGRRRGGIGTALVARAADTLAAEGLTVLHVLTLAESEPEEGDDTYAGTRAFYRKAGFRDGHEFRPAGWEQPALLLERPLG